MRKRIAVLLLLCAIFCCLAPLVFADNRDVIVYIASGSSSAYRYHARSTCPSLSRSVVGSLTLEEAACRGYTACSRCHPPRPDFDVSATPRPKTESSGAGTGSSSTRSYHSQSFTDSPSVSSSGSSGSTGGKSPSNSNVSSETSTIFLALGAAAVSVVSIRALKKRKEKKAEEEKRRLEQAERERIARDKWMEEERKKVAQRKAALEKEKENLRKQLEVWQKQRDEKKKQEEKNRLKKREAFEQNKRNYSALYDGRSTLECSGAPTYCFIGEDRLPACKDGIEIEKWGFGFTFYRTPGGKVYHSPKCKYAQRQDAIPVNAYDAKHHVISSCSYCRPTLPDLTWYEKYLEIKAIRKKYDIPEPKDAVEREEEDDALSF